VLINAGRLRHYPSTPQNSVCCLYATAEWPLINA
jgi:hypothetical protein